MTTSWKTLRTERLASPGAKKGYADARTAYEFGKRVRERREALGMSQAQLASATGTSQPAIARLEGGGTEPTLRTINTLARVLGMNWVIGPEGVTAEPARTA